MVELTRDARLSAAFVKMADTLVDEFDIVDLLDSLVHECTQLVAADAGGLLIADNHGVLKLIASTSEDAEFMEINQLNAGEGPSVESFRTGRSVTLGDIDAGTGRWSSFRAAAAALGFRSMHAIPMRLRGQTIGAMGLFRVQKGELSDGDAAVARALADVATIGILQERSLRDSALLAAQLQHALDSRVIIEQAKGIIAAQTGLGMHAAFDLLRTYARTRHLMLSAVAQNVADRSLVLER